MIIRDSWASEIRKQENQFATCQSILLALLSLINENKGQVLVYKMTLHKFTPTD